jgi:hypothetical protein
MNRAMLRAEALYYGALALPRHANVGRWKQLAETLASDSLKQWEIEDASHYQPIWLLSVFSYAEISGRTELFDSPIIRYYMEYFLNLLAPHGNVADFGDAHWNSGWDRFIPVFEKAGEIFQAAVVPVRVFGAGTQTEEHGGVDAEREDRVPDTVAQERQDAHQRLAVDGDVSEHLAKAVIDQIDLSQQGCAAHQQDENVRRDPEQGIAGDTRDRNRHRQQIADEMMLRLAALMPSEYHGYYENVLPPENPLTESVRE